MAFVYNSRNIFEFISAVAFFLLFPGFYFYHQAIAAGVIPSFMGGFFSPICLITLFFLIPLYKIWWKYISSAAIYSFNLFLFLFWTSSCALFTYWLVNTNYMGDALYQYLNVILSWSALFLIGIGLNLNAKCLQLCLWVSGSIIFFMLAYYVVSTGSLRYIVALIYGSEGGVASYQGFARSALILAFALLALSRSLTIELIVIIGSVFVLFVLSARSEFAAFIICIVLFFIFRSFKEKNKLFLALFIAGFIVIVTLFFYQEILQSRQANILDLSSDSSWIKRLKLMGSALLDIRSSPILGKFGGHFENGGIGAYSHNILSVWQAFGVFGFLVYFILVLTPAIDACRSAIKQRRFDDFSTLYFFVSMSSLILMLSAKSVYWPMPALAWGMYIRRASKRKYNIEN